MIDFLLNVFFAVFLMFAITMFGLTTYILVRFVLITL